MRRIWRGERAEVMSQVRGELWVAWSVLAYTCILAWGIAMSLDTTVGTGSLCGGWSLRNEGPGADWVCLDGPDSEAFRSAIAMSEDYGYEE